MTTEVIQDLIESYQSQIEDMGVEWEDNFASASFAFIYRDDLKNRWDTLSKDEQATVLELDKQLRAKREFAAEALPQKPSTDANRQAGRWWWFADMY